MDFDQYKTNLPYLQKPTLPSSLKDFLPSRLINEVGKISLDKVDKEIEETYKETSQQFKEWKLYKIQYEEFIKGREAYRVDQNRLEDKFRQDALADAGLTNHPKASKFYSFAWEHGHSGGLSEVLYWLREVADLVE